MNLTYAKKTIWNTNSPSRWLRAVLATICMLSLPSTAGSDQVDVALCFANPDFPTRNLDWSPSLRGKRYKLGGELEFEYVDTQDDKGTKQPSGHFQLDKFSLMPRIEIADNVTIESLLLFKADRASASEVYVTLASLPLNSVVKMGLDDRFIKERPGRKTEGFPLIDTAFARDDELGITWRGERSPFSWFLSISNGFALDQQAPGEDASYKLLHDNRQIDDMNQNKEIGLGIEWKKPLARECLADFLAFGYMARLSQEDITLLQDIEGYGSSGSDVNSMYGASMEGKLKSVTIGGKYIRANDGALDRYGWFAQASYRISLGERRLFAAVCPLLRYGRLKVDLSNIPTDPLTWDRSMTTLALLIEIAMDLMVKIEYCLNGEDTGGDSVNNDEFLMQMEMKF